mmetsp:Transcript_43649/g.105491  ORF Transcript_43649/g.105491 Transcript_43649/m.105491 type:complete len:218 (-) Transcript_43649:258-911(-)
MPQLPEPDDQCRRRREARHNRVREEAGDEAEAREAHEDLEEAAEQACGDAQGDVLGVCRTIIQGRVRDRPHPVTDEQGDNRHGADGELPRGAEQRVDDEGYRGRVEAVDGGKLRDEGVAHALRDQKGPHSHARRNIPAQRISPAALDHLRHPREGGDEGLGRIRRLDEVCDLCLEGRLLILPADRGTQQVHHLMIIVGCRSLPKVSPRRWAQHRITQ